MYNAIKENPNTSFLMNIIREIKSLSLTCFTNIYFPIYYLTFHFFMVFF